MKNFQESKSGKSPILWMGVVAALAVLVLAGVVLLRFALRVDGDGILNVEKYEKL